MICSRCSPRTPLWHPVLTRATVALAALTLCFAHCTRHSIAAEHEEEAKLAEEIRLAHEWAATAFAKPRAIAKPHSQSAPADALVVLRKSHEVLKSRTVWDTPLKLADRQYAHGIFMDAPAAVQVRLSRPAVEFTALVGIDDNANTQSNAEAGSVRFHVVVAGKRLFSTPVLKLRNNPVTVKVPLHGTKEFVLEVDDGGNGRGWDQCTWADAAVKLDDGSTRFLDELPLLPHRRTRQTTAPFSFTYDGQPSEVLLPTWEYSTESRPAKDGLRRVVSYKCPKTGLLLECHVTTYGDAAAIDWVFYLVNKGTTDTPVIDSFLPLDATLLEAEADQSVLLRSSRGDDNHLSETLVSFLPHDEPLAPSQLREFATVGGRSSNAGRLRNGVTGGSLPFFNFLGPDCGWILAVGWSGQWATEFARELDGSLTVGAGMATTHFRLHPGERVRTPRIVLLRYAGAAMIRGHNRFRQLLLKHYVQHRDGQPAAPPVCHNTAATVYRSGKEATEQNQLAIIKKAAELGCEAYWMDAYWYPRPWHLNVGNWYPRPDDFPRGLRPLGDAAHQAGMMFVLWFEPERVVVGTRFEREHPEFLLGEGSTRLYNLGDPEARRFLTDFLDERIKEWGVDMYRNDFNVDPLGFWRQNDETDRQGTTEMKYVDGLYQMWSELIRRNPGLTIDNCASGGRRIDVEICSLSYPLWRSDMNDIGEGLKGEEYWLRMARADQVHTAGLSLYLPFHAGPLWDMHPYSFRSAMTSSVVLYERILHDDFPAELASKGIAELKQLRPLFLGDIYPLMDLTTSQKDWYAYQLHRPDLNRGCAFIFRRPDAPDDTRRICLRKIDPAAKYLVSITGETYEEPARTEMSGHELLQLRIRIESKPGSTLLRYEGVTANAGHSQRGREAPR